MAVHISPARIQHVKERWEREVLAGLQRQSAGFKRMRQLVRPFPARHRGRDDRLSCQVLPYRPAARRADQLELFTRAERAARLVPGAWTSRWLRLGRRGKSYRRVWRSAGVKDLVLCSSAATVATGVCATLSMLFNPMTPPITWFATCLLPLDVGGNGSRASYRLVQESSNRSRPTGEPVLIYGAGRAGTTVVRELLSRPATQMRPVGFIDDDPGRAGKVFNGYPVLGSVATFETVIPRWGVRGVVIATTKVHADCMRAAVLICERNGIWMRQFRVRFEERRGTPKTSKARAATR